MAVIQRVVKATTRKGKKVLLKKEPQVKEGPKKCLFFQGRKSSEILRHLTKDLYNLRKPDAHMLTRKKDITIFEDAAPVEGLCKKFEAPLFVMGSHSKKRPDNLVIGRMYNYALLDMLELYVESYRGLSEFITEKIGVGVKSCLIFNGPEWEGSDDMKHLKSIFIDIFHREEVDAVRLQGLEHTISFTITEDKKILIRSYRVHLKKSGCRIPRVELEEIGPSIDLTFRRSKLPTEDLMKEALRRPKELKVAKKKNISTDGLGTKHGRIHVGKQEINKLQTRKLKGLKKSPEELKAYIKKRKILKKNESVSRVAEQKQKSQKSP